MEPQEPTIRRKPSTSEGSPHSTPSSPLLTPSSANQDPRSPAHHNFTTFAGHRFTNPAYITLALHIPSHQPTQPLSPIHSGTKPHLHHLLPIADRLLETCYRAALRSGQVPLLPETETEDLALQLSNRELGKRARRLGIDERVCWSEEAGTYEVPGEMSGLQAAGALKGLWVGVWMDYLGRRGGDDGEEQAEGEGAMEAVRSVMRRCGVGLPSGREFLRDWGEGMGRDVEGVRELRLAED